MSPKRRESSLSALEQFHPIVADWFRREVGTPTPVQEEAWPRIRAGSHCLISAPTGTGKTFAAFLTAIDRRIRGEGGRVLYVSPLKALNYDIERNLKGPLAALRLRFEEAGAEFPRIRVGVRSGDTEQAERRRLISDPPEILVTTPESLNLMLSSKNGLRGVVGFTTLIIDEIHAVLSSKRGTYLMSAVERLARLDGEFQRIALSATVRPLSLVGEILGGLEAVGEGESATYEPRRVEEVSVEGDKRYELLVTYPEPVAPQASPEQEPEEEWWKAVVARLRQRIEENRSTLIFANSRRMVEKLARLLNEEGDQPVYAHHGSLSREVRRVVEERLKAGELRGIVATSSLELGIDIGAIDEVVLVQAPFSIAAAVQRIGRAGHGVGAVSRGIFLPIHPRDLLESAPLTKAIREQAVEEVTPPDRPLDVLAQIVVSMAITGPITVDEILLTLRCVHAYRDLRKEELLLVVEMLAGKYADARIRELSPRVTFDRAGGMIKARKNAAMLLYMSGGVIPDRGYFNLREAKTNGKIGELDEEFVWERSLGDAFPFGNRAWRITGITNNDVLVVPADRSNSVVPFWRAEEQNRPYHFSSRIAEFLEEIEGKFSSTGRESGDEIVCYLRDTYSMEPAAAVALSDYLRRQRAHTRTALPHRRHLLVERYRDPKNSADAMQVVIHTFWGGAVNKPLALVISAVWNELYGFPLEVYANNDALLINLPQEHESADLFSLLHGKELTGLLRNSIEGGGIFGAHFRENAQRSLLLPRKSFKERMPLWLNRLRAKKLLQATADREDFPVTLETWRECMQTEFDLPRLRELLREVDREEIALSVAETEDPSPFADSIIWRQTNIRMYQDDSAPSELRTSLSDELLEEILHSPHLRPELPQDLIRRFQEKLQRLAPGYAPATAEDLLFWVEERLFIPAGEWEQLLAAMERDGVEDLPELVGSVTPELLRVGSDGRLTAGGEAGESVLLGYAARSNRNLLEAALSTESDGVEESPWQEPPLHLFLSRRLEFYAPLSFSTLLSHTPISPERVRRSVEALEQAGALLRDRFTSGAEEEEVCNRENLERLLRLRRSEAKPEIEPMGAGDYQWFLARRQGIARPGNSLEDLERRLEQLFGFAAPPELWEREILPARLDPYYPSWLDRALSESDLLWLGSGPRRITFGFEEDLDLFFDSPEKQQEASETERFVTERLATQGRRRLFELSRETGLQTGELTELLWELVWKRRVANDTMEALRSGIRSGFKSAGIEASQPHGESRPRRRRPGRGDRSRWKASRPMAGSWFFLQPPDPPENPLEEAELLKDRVRLLADRYGILYRELLGRELPAFSWRRLFRTLRFMELSGELITGRFIAGIRGLQFAPPRVLRELPRPEGAEEAEAGQAEMYLLNATDPASLCGAGLPGALPRRLPTTHLVFHGPRLALVSQKSGKELIFHVAPEHPAFGDYLHLFGRLLSRQEAPWKRVRVETINGEKPRHSPYGEALRAFGFVADGPFLTLYRSYE